MHYISISVQALPPKLTTHSLNKQTCDLNHAHSLTRMHYRFSYTCPEPKKPFPYQKRTPYKVRVVFSKPVHARSGPPGLNFTAKPSSHHVHVTLRVTTPTSPETHHICWQMHHKNLFLHTAECAGVYKSYR